MRWGPHWYHRQWPCSFSLCGVGPPCPPSFTVCVILWPWPRGPLHMSGGFCHRGRAQGPRQGLWVLAGVLLCRSLTWAGRAPWRLPEGCPQARPGSESRRDPGFWTPAPCAPSLAPSLLGSCLWCVRNTDVPDCPAGTQCCFPAPLGWRLRQTSDGGQRPSRVSAFVTLLYPRRRTSVFCPVYSCAPRGGGRVRRGCPLLCRPSPPPRTFLLAWMVWAGWCRVGSASQCGWWARGCP